MSVNQVNLMGRIGNIESKFLTNGNAVVNFSIATSERYLDKKTNNLQEVVDWHNCVAYGKTAETIGKWFVKGSEIAVTGKLKNRKWQDQSGQTRYATEVNVREFSFTGGSKVGNQQGDYQADQSQPNKQPQQPTFDDYDDDIPF